MDRFEKTQQPNGPNFTELPPAASHTAFPNGASFAGSPGCSAAPAFAIDEDQLERHRILAHRTRNAYADRYRILRTQVLQIMNKSGFKTLAITSPNYGDGKTTTSLNLALSVALDLKQTVLLVDLDLRKPNLLEFLGLEPQLGLSDYLLGQATLPQCLIRPPFERLRLLPAGKPFDNSSEILGSPQMAALAHELKTRYADRMVIYDMPPVLEQDDPLAFLPYVDAVLVVVRDGATPANDIKECLTRLASANVIGTVLNNSYDS